MEAEIRDLEPMLMIGFSGEMCMAKYEAGLLWQKLMPRRGEILDRIDEVYYGLGIYPETYFEGYSPERFFEKRVGVAVRSLENVPEEMASWEVVGGKYAVFLHRGSELDVSLFGYIFGQWLPQSGYKLDNRPHLERLDERYKRGAEDSEEEIWIPICDK